MLSSCVSHTRLEQKERKMGRAVTCIWWSITQMRIVSYITAALSRC